jgi:uncharacterized protein (TIGR00299 family) protein
MKDKILYLECYSGISGDMTVAALLDLGADQAALRKGLESLNVDGYTINISKKEKNSIVACDFDVLLDHSHPSDHEHKHEHHHEHTHEHPHEHPHCHNDMHTHEHIHSHDCDHHHEYDHISDHKAPAPILIGHHDHRNLLTINEIIEHSSITERAKKIAKRIFYIVAAAEAKAHGKPIEEVHFHEVGAIDSIVDIVATAICLDNLNIEEVVISELYEGTGFIRCQHGLLPIPVPAVVNIAAEHQLPLHITSVQGELVTPTGAAIAAAIRTRDTLPKEMKVLKIGLGAGKRNYTGASGLLRAMLIEDSSSVTTYTSTDRIWVLEANIDDCSGEALGYAMELLLQSGAKDVYYTPIFMKKNRPAYLLGVLCYDDKLEELEEIIFTHTTTIGIRKHQAERSILNRSIKVISTPYGDAMVKICSYKQKQYCYPEYESVKKLCAVSGKDYITLYREIQMLAQKEMD